MENHKVHCGGYKFSKVLIITWNTQFYHWQQMLSVAWSEGLTLFIFGKMSVSYSGLNSHIVCLLAALSSKNGIPWGKKAKNFWNNHDTSEYRSTLYTFWLSVPFSCSVMSHPVDCSTPGFSVHHQLPELAQTHIHQVGDAIQPSHPLSSPSLFAFNLSQHQDLFQEVSSLHQVAKVLEFQPQHQSFQWIFRTDFL